MVGVLLRRRQIIYKRILDGEGDKYPRNGRAHTPSYVKLSQCFLTATTLKGIRRLRSQIKPTYSDEPDLLQIYLPEKQ